MTTLQKKTKTCYRIFKMSFLLVVLIIVQNNLSAQVKVLNAPANKNAVTQKATPIVPPSKSAVAQKETMATGNIKRLNTSSAVALKKDFDALRQGDYTIVPLQLPGSSKVSDYYVKKSGSKLILNGDIAVRNNIVLSTMSYTKDDENHVFKKNDLYRWTNGTVPVVLNRSVFTGNNYNIIKSALNYFNFNTGIIFKERTGEQYYLVITCIPDDRSGKAGSTEVGRQKNGSNILELIDGKFTMGNVLHELMHTLGVLHEQARNDRDNFVEIKWDNIKDDAKNNFQIEGNATVRSVYDYCSIMQYPKYGFEIDPSQPTLGCKKNGVTTTCPDCLGQRDALSKMDLDGLNQLYGEIGISRPPLGMPFIASNVPVAGCIGVDDNLIKAKWEYYKDALGDCETGIINLGVFASTSVQFQWGVIYHTPKGVFVIYGDIYQLYKTNTTVNLGLPISDEEDINDESKGLLASWKLNGYRRISRFEKGAIVWGAPQKKTMTLSNEQFAEGPVKPKISEEASPTPVIHPKNNKIIKTKSSLIFKNH